MHPGHDDQFPLVCIDHGYLSGDATPKLATKDLSVERKGAADPHAVEKLAEWVDALGFTQVTIRSDGEPAVMQVAGAVRGARRAGSVTPLESSGAGGYHQNRVTIAWIIGHATTSLNLDTVGSDGKVPLERWRGLGHHMGRCVFGD